MSRSRILMGLVVCALVVAACGAPAAPTPEKITIVQTVEVRVRETVEVVRAVTPTPNPAIQVLRIGVPALETILDCHKTTSAAAMNEFYQLYDPLARITADGKTVPGLAESWEWVDSTTLQLKLRKDVVFHNGEKFDASVVKWNIERMMDPQMVIRNRIPTVSGAEVIDDYTVNILNKSTSGLLVRVLAVLFMIPPKYFEDVGVDAFTAKPVGTGPFKYIEGVPADYMILARNEDYWGGPPILSRVELRAIPEVAARVAALQAGDVDIIQDVPPMDVERLVAAGFDITWDTVARTHEIMMNTQLGDPGPLLDKRVRQAFNYAVDKEAIVTNLLRGFGEVATQQVDPRAVGYNPDVKGYPYDPDKAKQLLAEAGYPNGITTQIDYWATSGRYLIDKETAEAVEGYLRAIGVNVKIHILESSQFVDKFYAKDMTHLALQGQNYFPVLDADFIFTLLRCDVAYPWFCNREFDELYYASTTEADPGKRAELLQKAAAVLQDDPPVILLFHPPDITGMRPQVRGFQPRSDRVMSLYQVYIEE